MIHHIWLRDNCRCEVCFHPYTKQRLLSTHDIPLNIHPTEVRHKDDTLAINWSDGHFSRIPLSFLRKNSYDPLLKHFGKEIKQEIDRKALWTSSIASSMPRVSFNNIFTPQDSDSERAVLDWLIKIDRYGFCMVDDVPFDPKSTELLLKKIAFIRETHYGAFWDFTANMEHGDTAYTNLPLGAHTDTTYFSDPAGLQLFHLLSPPTSHTGGKSLLVDGFSVAAKLKEERPEAYNILSTLPVESHASGGEEVAFRPLIPQPVLSHHPRTGALTIIRWNPDDRKPIKGKPEEVKQWYEAINAWERILKSQEMELWMQMKMGQALIFDNYRVLHGRSSFTGERRLCGGYINGDDYRSRLLSLKHKYQKSKDIQDSKSVDTESIWNDID
ncbi:hypothetical protein BY996DRAFT_4377245 [Phakopsora pachyrhizi]|nr:hypothetical protein BY996DRAFT_4377245 [Phakopsora pachyrhizi]